MTANPYDPVTTSDSVNLGEDEWGLAAPKVGYRYSYPKSRGSLKSVCGQARQRPRCLLAALAVVVIVVLLAIIIAVASKSGHSPAPKVKLYSKWQNRTEGLIFYPKPADGSTLIEFQTHSIDGYKQVMDSIHSVAKAYDNNNQPLPNYVECSHGHAPPNKTCRFNRMRFGGDCRIGNFFGYKQAYPCVLLQLNLPTGVTIEPITDKSPLWAAAKFIMKDHNDSSSVPVTCEGKTKEDRDLLGGGSGIEILPPDGLPAYFYRPRDASLPFLKPAVMVRFTSLPDKHPVTIRCIAWGQTIREGKVEDHPVLSTEFVFLID